MNWQRIANLLCRYFDYLGLGHQFEKDGLFADIHIEKWLQSEGAYQYQQDTDFQEFIHYIAEWDGEFDSLYQVRILLDQLAEKIIQTNLSQNHINRQWSIFCDQQGWEKLPGFQGGLCAGYCLTSGLGLFLRRQVNKKLSESVPVEKLIGFEKLLLRIAKWNQKNASPEIENDFAVLQKYVATLQKNQAIPHKAINEIIGCDLIAEPEICVAWVHNEATLKKLFELLLRPGKFLSFGAGRHAAYVYMADEHELIYFNANGRYGYHHFNVANLNHFLALLPDGFKNCYTDKFALSVQVYDLEEAPSHQLTIENVIKELIAIDERNSKMNLRTLIDKQARDGMNALMMACWDGDHHEVELLIKMGADPNIKNNDHDTALYFAVVSGDTRKVAALLTSPTLETNALIANDYSALYVAVLRGHEPIVRLLLNDKRIRVNQPVGGKNKKSGYTALHLAAHSGDVDILTALMEHPDIRINYQQEKTGLTQLHMAVISENIDAVRLFLKNKYIKLDIPSKEDADIYPAGKTALCYAMELDELEIATELFAYGADLSYLPLSSRWLLLDGFICNHYQLYMNGSAASLDSMLKIGMLCIDLEDKNFLEFLSNRIIEDNVEVLNTLFKFSPPLINIMFNADPENEKNSFKANILQYAMINGASKVVALLLEMDNKLPLKEDSAGHNAIAWLASIDKKKKHEIMALFKEYGYMNIKSPAAPMLAKHAEKVSGLSLFAQKVTEIKAGPDEDAYSLSNSCIII
ncbi:ankyrin repeat domain-containing protein [Aquicella lusitana]|uniref:Ankyrin repeat protein n=1 Tax=Aquicella lusitana TaxID=254246 RepID=A0A370GWK9_9COXI|nr:ankyrin repeat domain-containing protein [Aquicella lusitana]RDI48075.1 ankyrin repeat protein [Aquicella lusitana]VVC72909.1 hypothetical protein AQULUS_06330 [Aquicella lusitana]